MALTAVRGLNTYIAKHQIVSQINFNYINQFLKLTKVITYPARACTSRSYVIGAGVHLYILYVCVCVCMTPKKFEWHFSGRLTFSTLAVDFLSNL